MKFTKLGKHRKIIILGIIFLVSVLAFWFGLRFALRTDYPLLPVDSGSMEPILYRGDLIIVQGVPNACEIEPGDIIVFHEWTQHDGELLMLKAVEKTISSDGSCSFETGGDAAGSQDCWKVKESEIVGRYVGKVPWLGHVPLFVRGAVLPFLSTPAGFLTVILVMLCLMLLEYIPLKKERAEA